MSASRLALVTAFALSASVAAAQPAPKPDDAKLVTRVYDVKHVLPRVKGPVSEDALPFLILQSVSLGEPRPGGDGPRLVERDGDRLEVCATEKVHGEIKDLLAALARLNDLAIDVAATVYELDAASYDKLAKVKAVGKVKPPVVFATEESGFGPAAPGRKALADAEAVLATGRVVQTSSGRFANGAAAAVSARRTVMPFANDPGQKIGSAREFPQFVREGFVLTAMPVASFDRRNVRLRLTEQSTAVVGVRKHALGVGLGNKEIVGQTPETEDLGATGSATVADGGTAIFRLAYAPKDKVWVVVLKPTIFIQAEQAEREKQDKK